MRRSTPRQLRLSLAWREARGSRRRGLLIVAAIAIGVAALVAINSFTDNLRESVDERRARCWAPTSCLGALALRRARRVARGRSPARDAARGRGRARRELRRDGVSAGRHGDAARAGAGGRAGLSLLRHDRDRPGRRVGAARRARRRVVEPSLLTMLGARVGDEIALGEARFVVRATIVSAPGDVGLRTALGPRVFIPRARVAETGLLTRGSRARYEAYLRFPPAPTRSSSPTRFRPALSAERVDVRTVADDQRRLGETLDALRQLPRPGGAGGAAARRPRRGERRPRPHPPAHDHGRRAALPRRVGRQRARSVPGAGGGRGPRSAASRAPPSASRSSSRCRACFAACCPWTWRGRRPGRAARRIGVGVWVAVVFSLLPLLAVRRVSPLAVLRQRLRAPGRAPRSRASRRARALGASLVALAVLQAGRLGHGLGVRRRRRASRSSRSGSPALGLVRGLRRFFPRRLPYL